MPRRSLAPTSGDVARPAHPAGCAGPGVPRTISGSERDLTVASAGAGKPKFDVNAVDNGLSGRASGVCGGEPTAPARGFSERATGPNLREQAGKARLMGSAQEGGKSSPQVSAGEKGALTCDSPRAQSPGSTMSQASEPDDP